MGSSHSDTWTFPTVVLILPRALVQSAGSKLGSPGSQEGEKECAGTHANTKLLELEVACIPSVYILWVGA